MRSISPVATDPTSADGTWNAGALRRYVAPVDAAFLAFFRIHVGAMMLWALWEFHDKNLITHLYVEPPFHFTYHGFDWVRPWPGQGMYLHFAGLAVAAGFVMIGFLYRFSAVLLWLGFTYVFLVEKAVYLNHYYLACLLCFLLVILPAHRTWSVDALLRPRVRSDWVPRWMLWLLRFQIALPYIYGGLAKLKGDWLSGQPMQMWLSISPWKVLLGPVVEEHWVALLFSWGGMLFDLMIVPLLFWQRTRLVAFGVAVLFHLLNAFMFDIGIFPWLMIGATTVFFPPDWPRRLVSLPPPQPMPSAPTPRPHRVVVALIGVYVLLQLLIPLRQWLYPGNVLWTEEGARFAWNMMLRAKVNALRFVAIDTGTRKAAPVDIARWLTPQQVESLGYDPEMMREFSHFVRDRYRDQGQEIKVHVIALCSLNGRKPQLLIDPAIDLASEPRTWFHQAYILPLEEPFRAEPWNVPVAEWERHLAKTRGK